MYLVAITMATGLSLLSTETHEGLEAHQSVAIDEDRDGLPSILDFFFLRNKIIPPIAILRVSAHAAVATGGRGGRGEGSCSLQTNTVMALLKWIA